MIRIAGIDFDQRRGQVLTPERDAIPFRNASTEGISLQMTQSRGPGFTLTLTRYDNANDIHVLSKLITAQIGARVSIVETYNGGTIDYFNFWEGRLLFAVTQARVIERRITSAWCGYRNGTHYNYSPACKVVSQWTMYAEPVPLV